MFWKKKTRGQSYDNPIRADEVDDEYAFIRGARCPECKTVGQFDRIMHGSDSRKGKHFSIHGCKCKKCGREITFCFDCSKQFDKLRSHLDPEFRKQVEEFERFLDQER